MDDQDQMAFTMFEIMRAVPDEDICTLPRDDLQCIAKYLDKFAERVSLTARRLRAPPVLRH